MESPQYFQVKPLFLKYHSNSLRVIRISKSLESQRKKDLPKRGKVTSTERKIFTSIALKAHLK